jgi:tetratricopeptide (TPR) repeat protein
MLIFLMAAAAAAAAPQSSGCPEVLTEKTFVCRALAASSAGDSAHAAQDFEQAAGLTNPGDPATARAWAAAGNMWIVAGDPAKATLDLDRALSGAALPPLQRGEVLLDRARAAEEQGDLKTARAKVTEASQFVAKDPFLWYFSAALAVREGELATAKSSIDQALQLDPNDPVMLFEAGHVAQLSDDDSGARDYWTRAAAGDPDGDIGKAARQALDAIGPALTVKMDPQPRK